MANVRIFHCEFSDDSGEFLDAQDLFVRHCFCQALRTISSAHSAAVPIAVTICAPIRTGRGQKKSVRFRREFIFVLTNPGRTERNRFRFVCFQVYCQ